MKDIKLKYLLIFGGIAFFILTKFFFNYLLWKGRDIPPEPGDVFNYLRWVEMIKTSYLNLTPSYPLYTFVLGNLAKIFGISSLKIFYFSFWIGFIILAICLLLFFKSLRLNLTQILLSFLFLALFSGHGSIHGFYWVVPSFFSFCIFLLLFAGISNGWNFYLLFFLASIFPLIHGTSVFALGIFGIYFIIYSLLKKEFDQEIFKRVLFVILIGFFSFAFVSSQISKINENAFAPQEIASKKLAYSEIFFSPLENVKAGTKSFGLEEIEKRLKKFKVLYLDPLLLHPIYLIFWIFVFLSFD